MLEEGKRFLEETAVGVVEIHTDSGGFDWTRNHL